MSKFFVRDTRQIVGNCLVFWRKEGQGYTTDLDDAMLVDGDWKERETDVLLSEELMRKLAKPRVDHQDLPSLPSRKQP